MRPPEIGAAMMDCLERTAAMPDRRGRLAQIDRAVARYTRVSDRLRARYTTNGVLTTVERGKPTRFARLADMAWQRFWAEWPD